MLVLLEPAFFEWFSTDIHGSRRDVASRHFQMVPIVVLQDAQSETGKKLKSAISQSGTEEVALLLTLTQSAPTMLQLSF